MGFVGRSRPVQRGFLALSFVSRSRLVFGFSRLPASTRRNSNNKRVCCVVETAEGCNERSIQGGRRYQTKGMRNQCRSGGGVLWCVVVTRVSCRCVRACVRGSSHDGLWPECHGDGLQRARGQHGNEKRCRSATSSVSQAGLALASRLVGDWYLSETRSDVGSTGARSRLRRRAGQANLKREQYGGGLLQAGFVSGKRVCAGMRAPRARYGNSSGHERRRRVSGGADCGRWGQTGRRRAEDEGSTAREGEGVHTTSEALRYARAVGIIAIIGGHWPAAVVTLVLLLAAPRHCGLTVGFFITRRRCIWEHAAMEEKRAIVYGSFVVADTPSCTRRPNLLCLRARTGLWLSSRKADQHLPVPASLQPSRRWATLTECMWIQMH